MAIVALLMDPAARKVHAADLHAALKPGISVLLLLSGGILLPKFPFIMQLGRKLITMEQSYFADYNHFH